MQESTVPGQESTVPEQEQVPPVELIETFDLPRALELQPNAEIQPAKVTDDSGPANVCAADKGPPSDRNISIDHPLNMDANNLQMDAQFRTPCVTNADPAVIQNDDSILNAPVKGPIPVADVTFRTPQVPKPRDSSQINLAPVESPRGVQNRRRGRKIKPFMDAATYHDKTVIRNQLNDYSDTMRVQVSVFIRFT